MILLALPEIHEQDGSQAGFSCICKYFNQQFSIYFQASHKNQQLFNMMDRTQSAGLWKESENGAKLCLKSAIFSQQNLYYRYNPADSTRFGVS